MKKTVTLIVSLFGLVFFSTLIMAVGIEIYYARKFNATNINVPLANLREKWGKEDKSITYNGETVIFYKRGFLGDSYVFKINADTQMVNSKFLDE